MGADGTFLAGQFYRVLASHFIELGAEEYRKRKNRGHGHRWHGHTLFLHANELVRASLNFAERGQHCVDQGEVGCFPFRSTGKTVRPNVSAVRRRPRKPWHRPEKK